MQDCASGRRFLVDTGTEPASLIVDSGDSVPHCRQRMDLLSSPTDVINTGHRAQTHISLDIDHLKSDFLSSFNLGVSIRQRRLLDETTTLSVGGVHAMSASSPYEAILAEFPDIMKPCSLSSAAQHDVPTPFSPWDPQSSHDSVDSPVGVSQLLVRGLMAC